MKDRLDSQEFYELMQSYRNAPFTNQDMVVKCFNEVKEFILDNLNGEP